MPGFVYYHCRHDLGRGPAIDCRRDQLRCLQRDGLFTLRFGQERLYGSEHYKTGRHIGKPSPWAEGDFEEKMAMLLRWADTLNRSDPAFAQALNLLEGEDSRIGRASFGAPRPVRVNE